MTVREELEQREHRMLNPLAAFSDQSKGRPVPEEPREMDVRTCYQRDTDRIVHSKAFRRLMHKTQVFLRPEGDHYRTRMTHTLEVARIAMTITRALNLNEDLADAIAMGHDLGHTGAYIPQTLEGQIVRRSDQIAYVNHDIDDAIRAGILTNDDIPRSITEVLGQTHRDRINTLVCDAIQTSTEAGRILLSPEVDNALRELRAFMFERVYRNPVAKGEESKAKDMLKRLYEYYVNHPDALPTDFQPQLSFDGMERTVCDYIAGMTDKYAVDKYTELFIPMGWRVRG